jgi:hypothetical protein
VEDFVVVRSKENGDEYVTERCCVDEATEEIIGDQDAVTADEIGEYLDLDAESANYHDFVGAGRAIARLVTKYGGEAAAKEVLLGLAAKGGFIQIADGGWGDVCPAGDKE